MQLKQQLNLSDISTTLPLKSRNLYQSPAKYQAVALTNCIM